MALANTTLAAACTATDKQITVASATSIAQGTWAIIDGTEVVQVTKGYTVGSTTVPLHRAQEGTAQIAHPTGAQISFYLLHTDFPTVNPGLDIASPPAGRGRYVTSITASGAWTPQTGNQDELVLLNGTSVIALTITNPTRDQTGKMVIFCGNGIAAHTVTYTTVGFGNVGATADVMTFSATQAQAFQMIASGGFWNLIALGTASANVTGPTLA